MIRKKVFSFLLVLGVLLFNVFFGFNLSSIEKNISKANYFDTGNIYDYHEEIINYSRYEMSDVHLERLCPNYTNSDHTNSCAPMAATMIVGYYDYVYTNLIENFTPGYYYNGSFYYFGQNDLVYQTKVDLMNRMGTNTIKPGTSVSQFKTGFTSFVNSKGLNISYNKCGNNLDLNLVKQYLNAGQPIAVFVNSYDYYPEVGLSDKDNTFAMYGRRSPNGHVFVAFGWREYKFYDENDNLFRTEKVLVVSQGDGTQGFLSVNDISKVDEAYGINIYS